MNETRLTVNGMSCPSCIRHIQRALDAIDGIDKVEVNLRAREVRVWHEPEVGAAALTAALAGAGYEAALAS